MGEVIKNSDNDLHQLSFNSTNSKTGDTNKGKSSLLQEQQLQQLVTSIMAGSGVVVVRDVAALVVVVTKYYLGQRPEQFSREYHFNLTQH